MPVLTLENAPTEPVRQYLRAHEQNWNPTPTITQCPCGHSLEKCLSVTVTDACTFNDKLQYAEFLKTTLEWFVRALADGCT